MSWKTSLARLRGLVRRSHTRDSELQDEIRTHVEMETEENIERGMTGEEARRAALVKFGNPQLVQEDSRAMWSLPSVESVLADVKYGWRMLWKTPGWTAVAVLTLSLGIGATTAIFSVAYSILVRPLPYADPEQLVLLHQYDKTNDTGNWRATALDYLDWRDRARSFNGIAAYTGLGLVFTGSDAAEKVVGQRVSYNLFSVLGVAPFLGRDFRYEEEEKGRDRVVVLSYGLWQRRFGGDRGVLGRTVTINNEPFTVIGVMPRGFAFPDKNYQAWLPVALRGATDPQWVNRSAHFLRTIGRLKPGVSIEAGNREIKQIAADLEGEYADTNTNEGGRAESLTEKVVGDVRSSLVLLLFTAGCLLLIACTNVANLLMARGISRQREIAVRQALGATNKRILRQLMTENLLLTLAASAVGCALAYLLVAAVLKLGPEDIPRLDEVRVDATALLFAFSTAIATGLLFGLAPLASLRRSLTSDELKSASRMTTGGRHIQQLRSVLVISQIAICGLLLFVAGLTVRSLMRLNAVDPGFNPDHAVTFNLIMIEQSYPGGPQLRAFSHRVLDELSGMPDLESVGFTTSAPLTGNSWANPVSADGGAKSALIGVRAISTQYFEALQTPLRRGRFFTAAESATSERVAIINETAAAKLFPGADPLGRHVKLGQPDSKDEWRRIVGVVADLHEQGLDVTPGAAVFFPYDQLGDPVTAMALRGIYVVMRTKGDPGNAVGYARARISQIDPNVPTNDVQLLREMVSESVAQPRFRSFLFTCFAGIALLLAAVGLYGVLSYAVSQRTHEFGIRIALGASGSDLLRLVLKQGSRIVVVGLVLAFVLSAVVRKLVVTLLFGVSPADPLTLAGVACVIAMIAAIATMVPARRAMRSDPMAAIRSE
jgi:putative ABC transport system permease protein